MSKRLNGWQRIGIVLSVLWALGGGYWGNQVGLRRGEPATAAYRICLDTRGDDAACSAEFDKAFRLAVADHWVFAALVGLVPIPLGWLAVSLIVGVGRWVRKGFHG